MNLYFVTYSSFNTALKFVLALYDFRIWPNYQRIHAGSSAVIYCDSDEPTWWTFEGDVSNDFDVSDNTLILHSEDGPSVGTCICHGVSKSGEMFRAKAIIEVDTNISNVNFS